MPDVCHAHLNVLWGGVACPQCDAEAAWLQTLPPRQREAMAAMALRLEIITVLVQNLCEALGVSQEHPGDREVPHAQP